MIASSPSVMAILNVTPDSFSDGGIHPDPVSAGLLFLDQGADIIDVGGESTRPGADPVLPPEEQRRILPVIEALARRGALVSVDTRNASTMAAALEAGAAIVNDVSALAHDPESLGVVASHRCRVVLMHMRGTPQTMASQAVYGEVVPEVLAELSARIARAEAAGIERARIIIDPGLGFAKTPAQSVAVLRAVGHVVELGFPVMVGASRKGFLGLAGGEPDARARGPGSIAAALFAAVNGVAILRVHDVAETVQALRVWRTLAACDS